MVDHRRDRCSIAIRCHTLKDQFFIFQNTDDRCLFFQLHDHGIFQKTVTQKLYRSVSDIVKRLHLKPCQLGKGHIVV